MDLIALTEEKTRERYDKETARALRTEGYGATPVSLKITQDCIPILSSYVSKRLEDTQSTLSQHKVGKDKRAVRTLLLALRQLDPTVIALCALNSTLHACGKGEDMRALSLSLGTAINSELWAAGLIEKDDKLAKRIEKAVRVKHGNIRARRQAARSIAKRLGYRGDKWTKEALLKAGWLLASWVLDALPDVFYTFEIPTKHGSPRVYLAVREEALDVAIAAVGRVVAARPANLPCVDPPLSWTGLHYGGYPDARLKGRVTLLRKHSKVQGAMVRSALRDGSMQPVLDAVNAVQSVAWKINTRVLAVMRECVARKISVGGMPRATPFEKPAHTKEWDDMSYDERKAWRRRADKIETKNRGLGADRLLFEQDLSTAELLASAERFYTPANADWRGRVYPLPHFNFQRDDRVRALFLFADGAPIGADGLKWLKVHVANCGGFDGVDKRSIEERTAWVDDWMPRFHQIALHPLSEVSFAVWSKASEPFLFLAACMELSSAIAEGPSYTTRLPISFDGSCSGLQHLAAMTRDASTAKLVNLTASPVREDVYQTVAEAVAQRLRNDLTSDATMKRKDKSDVPVRDLAQLCLAHGVDRTLVKRNVMTFAYSSKKFGMAQQHNEDLMRPLETEVLAGELDEHPFAYDGDAGRAAAKYLAGHIYEAITRIVTLPAEAMAFLQTLARALAHESKPLCWTAPTGLPWVNAYYEPDYVRVQLWLHNSSVTVRLQVGDKKEVDKNRASNGVAPNLVHACDAAHLMLTVNAAVRDGIRNIATVHDSFGCLAPQAARFNEIIREEFVSMYAQHDVLAEVFEQAKRDLRQHNWHRLPDAVAKGALNIEEVLNAQFAFA